MIDDVIVGVLILIIFYEQLMHIAVPLSTNATAQAIEYFQHDLKQFWINNAIPILILKILYHTFFIWHNGMTPGKYLMKIKVVSLEGQSPLDFSKALLRASLRIVSEMLFYLGFLLAFFLPLRQTLHDKLSYCVVVDA